MQNVMISEKEESHLECCFVKKLFTCWWVFFVKILTRKREKNLQLIWPLKYDTVFRTDLL